MCNGGRIEMLKVAPCFPTNLCGIVVIFLSITCRDCQFFYCVYWCVLFRGRGGVLSLSLSFGTQNCVENEAHLRVYSPSIHIQYTYNTHTIHTKYTYNTHISFYIVYLGKEWKIAQGSWKNFSEFFV